MVDVVMAVVVIDAAVDDEGGCGTLVGSILFDPFYVVGSVEMVII